MSISGKRIGFGLTGSFCTLQSALAQMQKLVLLGADVIPVVSYAVKSTDTRFGTAEYFLEQIKMISGKECIASIADAEP